MTVIAGPPTTRVDPGSFSYLRPMAPIRFNDARTRCARDDLYVLRLRRDFLKEIKLELGFAVMTRSENWSSADGVGADRTRGRVPGRGIWSVDGHVRLFGSDVNFAHAEAYPRFTSGNGVRSELTVGKRSTGLQLPDAALFEGEIHRLPSRRATAQAS